MRPTLLSISLFVLFLMVFQQGHTQQATKTTLVEDTFDRDYSLEASMLGYFAPDGSRNPTLRANKGDRVRIKITNTELMTHDIVLEKWV